MDRATSAATGCQARFTSQRLFFSRLFSVGIKVIILEWLNVQLNATIAVEARPFGDQPLIGAEISEIRFGKPIPPETTLAARITFEAIEEGKGQFSYNILQVFTLDAATDEVLIRQKRRMLRTWIRVAIKKAQQKER